ncbi:MAG: transcription factor S [Ignisphaera sp.]
MMFCPKCGSIMNLDTKKRIWRCSKCGYEFVQGGASKQHTYSRVIKHVEKEKTVVVENEKSSAPPTAVLIKNEVRCPKCEYNEVYAWQIQTRAADEPPTTFYKCAKCGYTWREY